MAKFTEEQLLTELARRRGLLDTDGAPTRTDQNPQGPTTGAQRQTARIADEMAEINEYYGPVVERERELLKTLGKEALITGGLALATGGLGLAARGGLAGARAALARKVGGRLGAASAARSGAAKAAAGAKPRMTVKAGAAVSADDIARATAARVAETATTTALGAGVGEEVADSPWMGAVLANTPIGRYAGVQAAGQFLPRRLMPWLWVGAHPASRHGMAEAVRRMGRRIRRQRR